MNIHTRNLPICNSGQYIYSMKTNPKTNTLLIEYFKQKINKLFVFGLVFILYFLKLSYTIGFQYIYVMGLCKFLFVLQDLIDRINSYFQRIAFQRNLLLISF